MCIKIDAVYSASIKLSTMGPQGLIWYYICFLRMTWYLNYNRHLMIVYFISKWWDEWGLWTLSLFITSARWFSSILLPMFLIQHQAFSQPVLPKPQLPPSFPCHLPSLHLLSNIQNVNLYTYYLKFNFLKYCCICSYIQIHPHSVLSQVKQTVWPSGFHRHWPHTREHKGRNQGICPIFLCMGCNLFSAPVPTYQTCHTFRFYQEIPCLEC